MDVRLSDGHLVSFGTWTPFKAWKGKKWIFHSAVDNKDSLEE